MKLPYVLNLDKPVGVLLVCMQCMSKLGHGNKYPKILIGTTSKSKVNEYITIKVLLSHRFTDKGSASTASFFRFYELV